MFKLPYLLLLPLVVVSLTIGYVYADYDDVPTNPVILNGDVNLDCQICMDDSIQIIYHLWRDGRELPCPDAADIDRSGIIDIGDVIGGLRHVFFGDPIFDCPIACEDQGYYPE